MSFKALLFYLLTTNAFADLNNLILSGSSSIQYRQDQIRERVNSNETNITNLSIIADSYLDNKKSEKIRVELLGEENISSNDLYLTVGEVFYQNNDILKRLNFKIGLMKLNYGLLNPIDGTFARLSILLSIFIQFA